MMSNKENVVPPLADVSNLKKRPSPSTQTEVAFPPQKKKAQTFSDKTFDRGFESIVEFKKKNGHINIPYRCEENRPLGAFCAKVRKAQDELTQDQRDRLNSVGFCWETTQDRLWNEKYERLKQYHGKHGNCLVPTTYKEDRELSEWCSKQRAKYTQGRLSKDRMEKLNWLGFVYRINKFIQRKATPREDKKWLGQLEKLLMFSLEWGHTLVPFQYKGDKSLGRWVNEQRCNNMRGILRDSRKALLDEIGFVWKVTGKDDNATSESKDPVFDLMFRQLVEYKIMHGNFNNVEQHEALGKWAAGQKYLLEMGKMNQIRMLRFMAIGFCNSEMDSLMFAKYIAKLQATKAKDGSCDYASLEQPALAIFCAVQRYLLKKGTLSQERKQRLQSIGFNVKDFQPLHLPLPESRYVSRESSIVSLKTMVKTDDKKITHPKKTLKQKIDEAFDDSTVSSKNSDGNTTLDTTLDTSMDSSASSPQKELRQRENEGFLGLLAIAMEWKG